MHRSKSTSPAKNSAANYESAAKDIEQEKRMVAALKRLSFGHLLNTDPDIPAPDAHYSFVVDNQMSDAYSDSHSLDSTSSSSSSSAHHSPVKDSSQTEMGFYDSESSFDPHASESDTADAAQTTSSSADIGYSEETLWVPANIHPEINPQQFKNHVKTTIDELLERKISRSKSANRSKRSSLSFSTTDDIDDDDSDSEIVNTSFNADSMNPSLRELSSELQAMSRLAGMDSNDAITLARSLSTSTIGYSDVEKLAFGKIGNANYSSPQAEMLDLGDEPSHQHSGHADDQASSSRSSYKQSPNINGSFNLNPLPNGYRRPSEDFALKRSRRLDYRKNPSSSSSGSQLQNGKANKLAELRHTLNSSLTTDLTNGTKSPSSPKNNSRNSVQSFNPRNSQVLFSYKKSSSKSPAKSSPTPTDTISMADFASKDSPYLTTSSTASFEQNIHPTKYGQRKLTPKAYRTSSGPPPSNQPTPHHSQRNSLSRDSSSRKPSSRPSSPQMVPKRSHDMPSRESSRNSSREELQYRGSPENPPYKEHSGRRSSSSIDRRSHSKSHQMVPSNEMHYYPGSNQHSPHPHHHHQQQQQQRDSKYNHGKYDENSLSGSPNLIKTKSSPVLPRASSTDRMLLNDQGFGIGKTYQGSSQKYKEYRAREKTRELNQNLDLFRDELNDFKEKLNKSERRESRGETPVAEAPVKSNDSTPEQPDLSFDLTSHDVSYDDSLGIEKEVLSELKDDHKEKPVEAVKAPRHSPFINHAAEAEEHHENHTPAQFRAVSDSKVPDSFYAQNHVQEKQGAPETTGLKTAPITPIDETQVNHQQPNEETITHSVTNLRASTEEPENDINKKASLEQPEERSSQEVIVTERRVSHDPASLSNASLTPTRNEPSEKKKSRKTWLWSKEKSQSNKSSPAQEQQQTPVPVPSRSVSSPEVLTDKKSASSAKEESTGRENVITKLFKKRRSSSVSQEKSSRDNTSRQSIISSGDGEQEQAVLSRKSSHNSVKSQKLRKSSSEEISEAEIEVKSIESAEERKPSDNSKTSRLKNKIKSMTKIHEEKPNKSPDNSGEIEAIVEEPTTEEEDSKPKSTLEVQERLKKSIRRTSKANQPIEFTDSAFGFPLPPPSTSTLVMIDYRFPVHVERAIYRLSHLKLANPKRSLREQVLLSNFMYAYLNLVDHTLHLEQQMSSEEYEVEQPEQDANLLGDQDVDTDFEGDGKLEGGDFETIKIDLDVNSA